LASAEDSLWAGKSWEKRFKLAVTILNETVFKKYSESPGHKPLVLMMIDRYG
jgi:hypothetical protein